MPSKAWSSSARKPAASGSRDARPFGSFEAAIDRARVAWDELTDHPAGVPYSALAAQSILSTALALWPEVARSMMAPGDEGET